MIGGAQAWADITCTGTIVDDNGEPLVGASVFIPGTKTGVVTNADGQFSLRVPDRTRELQVEYIGFKSVNIPAGPPWALSQCQHLTRCSRTL